MLTIGLNRLLALAAIAATGIFWSGDPLYAQSASPGGIVAPNNSGIITQGQSGGTNIINQGPRRLELTDALKAFLLQKLPKDKPGEVDIIGPSPADHEVGMNIFKFLKDSGYFVHIGYMDSFVNPSPNYALTLQNSPDSPFWIFQIAPSLPMGP